MNLGLQQTAIHFYFQLYDVFHAPSAVCVLWLLLMCIQLSVLKTVTHWRNVIFVGLGMVYFVFLTE